MNLISPLKHEYKDGSNTSKKQKKRKRSDAEDDMLENEKIENIKEHDAEQEIEVSEKKSVVRKQIVTDDTIPVKQETQSDDNLDRKE